MTTKNIIIHAGLHKTGSTSIQGFLGKHRETLLCHGIDFFTGAHFPNNHVEIHAAAMQLERTSSFKTYSTLSFDEQYRQRTEAHIKNYIANSNCNTLVFSAEGISLLRYEDEISRLQAMFSPHPIQLIIYMRDLHSYRISYRNELLKHKQPEHISKNSFLYAKDDSWLFNLDQRISAFQDVFGHSHVTLISYNDALQIEKNVIPSFLRAIGAAHLFQQADWDNLFLNKSPPLPSVPTDAVTSSTATIMNTEPMPTSSSTSAPAKTFEKIYLHIGLKKTGTSYLQSCLDTLSNTGQLKNISYPVLNNIDDFKAIRSGNGEAVAFQLLEELVPVFSAPLVEQLLNTLVDAADREKPCLLISSEHFSVAEPARMKVLHELLLTHTNNVELIIGARPLGELCYSMYHQLIKRHGVHVPYDKAFFDTFSQELIAQLEMLEPFMANAQVIAHQKQGLLNEFLNLLGEGPADLEELTDAKVNRSLTAAELVLLGHINSVFNNGELSTRISDRWIYAKPDAQSPSNKADNQAIEHAFSLALAERHSTLSTPAAQQLIAVLTRCTEADTASPSGIDAPVQASQEEHLLIMALEEINNFLNISERLQAYTKSLKPTKEAFDPIHYLLLNRDVLAAGANPVEHFKIFGRKEGRNSAYNLTSVLV